MNTPGILTAVIPTNNTNVLLESIKKWDFTESNTNIDLIFVLDSVKKSEALLFKRHIANSKFRTSLVLEGNFGSPGAARNAGMNLVKTTWVTFWDSDDLPIPKEYIQLVEKCDSENKEFGLGGFSKVAFDGRKSPKLLESKDGGSVIRDVLLDPGIWRWVFKYENVKNVPFKKFFMGEDQIFLLETGAIFSDKSVLTHSIYNYSTGFPYQLTANKEKVQDLEQSINHLRKHLINLQDTGHRTILYMFIIKMHITFLKVSPSHLVPLRILRFVGKSFYKKEFYKATITILSLRNSR